MYGDRVKRAFMFFCGWFFRARRRNHTVLTGDKSDVTRFDYPSKSSTLTALLLVVRHNAVGNEFRFYADLAGSAL